MKDYENTPLWNNQLPIEERLDYLLKELTLEEKLECLGTTCPEVPRLGIKPFGLGGEAAHGVEARHDQEYNRGEPCPTTSFPQPIGMSGSFDKDLIRECGRVVGEEARALYHKQGVRGLSRWAPTIDMERDPRWGRTEEAYGEDPYLVGEMSSGYIQGMRGDDPFYVRCAATLKHFYGNNVEKNRATASSSIDSRNKHEYYLEPFRKAVVEGGAEGIMASYNEINGIPAIVNDEIQKIVKDEWGLPGHVVSDGSDFQQTVTEHKFFETHAETLAAALRAGVDGFPEKPDILKEAANDAVKRGLITEEDVNRSVRNTFRTRIRLGLFDKEGACPYSQIGDECLNTKESQEIAMQMAKDSIVLLKNEDNLLPIKAKRTEEMTQPKIFVVGPLADVWFKDWYCGIPPYSVTPLEGIKAEYPEAEITCISGLNEVKILCGGRYIGLDGESNLYMTSADKAEIFIAHDWGNDSFTLRAKSNGLYVTMDDGTRAITATKPDVFDWFVREVWKLEEIAETSTSRALSRSAGMENFHLRSWNSKKVFIDENHHLKVVPDEEELANELTFSMITVVDGIKEASNLAFGADYVFAFVGTNPVINAKECYDRDTLALPPHQQKLAERMRGVNVNTVLTIISNYPHSLGNIGNSISTILFTASGAMDLGHALAQTISGRSIPAGRLSMTWYKDEADLPDINDYDIIKGNRTYQYFDKEVLFPFGHGLSYSRFVYKDFIVSLDEAKKQVEASLIVRNSGYYHADEVVQLYVRKDGSRVKRAFKQLKAFTRIKNLSPGERREVKFSVALSDLRFFDVISEKMVLEDGDYTFMVGASSLDIRGEATVTIAGEKIATRDPYTYTKAMNYDDYRNIYLHRGTKHEDGSYTTCVAPKAAESAGRYSSCKIIYNDFVFDKAPAKILVDVLPTEVCKMVVYVDMNMVATEDYLAESGFGTKEIAVNPEKVAQGQKVSVQIQIYGNMRIEGFVFA